MALLQKHPHHLGAFKILSNQTPSSEIPVSHIQGQVLGIHPFGISPVYSRVKWRLRVRESGARKVPSSSVLTRLWLSQWGMNLPEEGRNVCHQLQSLSHFLFRMPQQDLVSQLPPNVMTQRSDVICPRLPLQQCWADRTWDSCSSVLIASWAAEARLQSRESGRRQVPTARDSLAAKSNQASK